ncbi:LAME_0B07382g1_1 [Lachancea meyersii CBS 8951]|uniref:LAME_0B07382g1_1 n=1 Tax=Lachancea meyersii CBS 8951 TaxID=1266667 RepID=A0A1G4IWL9_9SACH|nr:LAME_0B07382g1_1 [Lachancea meyersii CBS 8951]
MSSTSRRVHRKTGCVPCKLRKKRCSEHKPVCTDCERLGITCIYLPEKCSREKINFYREQVEKELSERKRRKPSGATTHKQPKRAPEDLFGEITSDAVLATLNTPSALDLIPYDRINDPNFLGFMPSLPSPLPPISEPSMMQLDDTAMHLYNYYRDSLSHLISIAPTRQNYYLQIFLPMAHQNEGILYGILAWAAHHLSLGGVTDRSSANRALASSLLKEQSPAALDDTYRDITIHESGDEAIMSSSSPISSSSSSSAAKEPPSPPSMASFDMDHSYNSEPDSRYAAVANEYTLYSLQKLPNPKTEGLLPALANLLVLCGAEICQGDVERWRVLLRCGARMIKDQAPNSDIGELLADSEKPGSQLDAKVTRWLLSNFAYHDILGSDKSHFPMEQYSRILEDPAVTCNYTVDPLYGVNRPIFQILGQVKNLARKVKQVLAIGGHNCESIADGPLHKIIAAAQRLQVSLYSIQPSENDLAWYQNLADNGEDARPLAKTLFSVFRTTALLHLKTAVLRQNKESYEIQYLVWELSSDLDKVLGTRLEGGLCFPLFICGVNSFNGSQRQSVELKFANFLQRYKFRNVERAFTVVRQLWHNSDRGRIQDWYDIVDEIGWDLNFA